MNWILFFVLIILTFVNFMWTKKTILHPSVLACGIFSISSFLMALNGSKWRYEISIITFIYIIIALIVFTYGVNLGEHLAEHSQSNKRRLYDKTTILHYHINFIPMLILSVISIFVSYLYFRHQYAASVALGNNLGIPGMVFFLRKSTVFDAENDVLQLSNTLNIGLSFVRATSQICLFLIIYKLLNKEKGWFRYLIPLLCLIANIILATGRGGFISLVSAVIFDLFIITRIQHMGIKTKKILKYSLFLIVSFLVVFYLLGSLTGKDEALSFNDTVAIYAGSSILCLDYMLTNGWETPVLVGMNSFKGLYGIIGRFLGGVPTLSNHAEMVRWSNYSSNVYTSFAPYIKDFGLIGSVVLIFFIGYFFGYIWKRFLEKGRLSLLTVIYGSMFGYALCMFSIAERVLSQYIALNVIAQLIFIKILLDIVVKKKILLYAKQQN